MTIETKYNIGDEVWVIFKHKAQQVRIDNIRIIGEYKITDIMGNAVDIIMKIYYGFPDDEWICEKLVFPTKEELIKSL